MGGGGGGNGAKIDAREKSRQKCGERERGGKEFFWCVFLKERGKTWRKREREADRQTERHREREREKSRRRRSTLYNRMMMMK